MAQDFAYLRKARHSNQFLENRAGQGEWRDGKDSKEACAGRIDFEEIRSSARQPKALNRKGRKQWVETAEKRLTSLCFSLLMRLSYSAFFGGFYFAGSALKGSSARQVSAHIGCCAA